MERQRDAKGRFVKGNATQISGEQAAILGAKGGSVTKADRIGRFLSLVKAKPLSREELEKIDAALLTMTREELQGIINDASQPIIVQSRAQMILNPKTSFDGTERMVDRLYGKPTQKQQVEGDMNLGGKVELQPLTDEELEELKSYNRKGGGNG